MSGTGYTALPDGERYNLVECTANSLGDELDEEEGAECRHDGFGLVEDGVEAYSDRGCATHVSVNVTTHKTSRSLPDATVMRRRVTMGSKR